MRWLLSVLILLVAGSQGYSLSLSDLITRSRVYLRDTSSDPSLQKFSDTQITRFLNDGQKEVNLQAWAIIASTRFPLATGTTEYSLPSGFILPLRATVNNSPIVERTFSFLDEARTDWISNTGTPDSYYIRADSSVVSGVTHDSVGFVPVTTFTIVIELQYLAEPVDLSLSGDIPFGVENSRLESFHQILCYYAAYRGFLAWGESMANTAAFYLREYQNMATLMEASIKNRQLFNPSFRGNLAQKQTQQ